MSDKPRAEASKGGLAASKKRVTISYVIREPEELQNRAGVNCLQFDELNRVLYTAGRDSIIRSWSCRKENAPAVKCSLCMDGHSDWVNSIILSEDKNILVSGSSDTLIKIWDLKDGSVMQTFQTHTDYVTALAYANCVNKFASASLDHGICIWDLEEIRSLTQPSSNEPCNKLSGQKNSIYSIAVNTDCSLLVSGSTEKMLRVWDPRTQGPDLMQLRGHSDNVRTLALSDDGAWCVSGSSDKTLKLWSISQQRCVRTMTMPDSVWVVRQLGDISQVLAGLKDGSIYWVDIKSQTTKLIVQENAPILNFCIDQEESLLWVSTTDSTVRAWKIDLPALDGPTQESPVASSYTVPKQSARVIPGAPRIRDFSILKDRRHILTKDSANDIQLWDVMYAKFVDTLGKGELENYREEMERKMLNNMIPNWFTVRIKTGLITICIDEVGWNTAWILASQTDLPGKDNPGLKYNLGCLMLKGVFADFIKLHETEKEKKEDGKVESLDSGFLSVPGHTPILLTESDDSGVVIYRLLAKDSGEKEHREKLKQLMPLWALNYLLHSDLPQQTKINFTITPHKSIATDKTASMFNPSGPTRLNGCDTVAIRKIIEYTYEQIHKSIPEPGEEPQAVDLMEVLCNGQVLSLDLDMRSIKYQIWKSPTDIKLEYRYKVIQTACEEKSTGHIENNVESNP